MSKVFCLVNLSIFVLGSTAIESFHQEKVDIVKGFCCRNTSAIFNNLRNIVTENSTRQWKELENLNDLFIKNSCEAKVESALDITVVDVPETYKNSDRLRQSVSYIDRKRVFTSKQQHLVSDDDIKLDYINLTFSEKERKDGFKRTLPEDNPYAVLIALINKYNPDKSMICSGSLITTRCVLTAAHCFKNKVHQVLVYAGGNSLTDLQSNHLARHSQVREEHSHYLNPRYRKESDYDDHDVAVIIVSKAFKMTRTVKTVKLLRRPWAQKEYKACIVTGFGSVYHEQEDPEDYTRKTHYLEVKTGCPCLHDDSKELVICSRLREDYGICTGDSGSGLICSGTLVAVTTYVMFAVDIKKCNFDLTQRQECGSNNTISIFHKIYPFLDFVDSTVQKASTYRSCHANVHILLILLFIVYL